MKRAILTGAVAFLLGAATSPRAANENETLTLLCKRFEITGGGRILAYSQKRAATLDARLEVPWRDTEKIQERIDHARAEATIDVLGAVRSMACAK